MNIKEYGIYIYMHIIKEFYTENKEYITGIYTRHR